MWGFAPEGVGCWKFWIEPLAKDEQTNSFIVSNIVNVETCSFREHMDMETSRTPYVFLSCLLAQKLSLRPQCFALNDSIPQLNNKDVVSDWNFAMGCPGSCLESKFSTQVFFRLPAFAQVFCNPFEHSKNNPPLHSKMLESSFCTWKTTATTRGSHRSRRMRSFRLIDGKNRQNQWQLNTRRIKFRALYGQIGTSQFASLKSKYVMSSNVVNICVSWLAMSQYRRALKIK